MAYVYVCVWGLKQGRGNGSYGNAQDFQHYSYVAKSVFPHPMPKESVVRAHLGIQIAITIKKSSLGNLS